MQTTINFTTDFDNNEPIISEHGDDVHFIITANAFPDISFIDLVWYKDEKRLHLDNSSHYESNVYTENQTSLISFLIQSSQASDSGIYTLVGSTSTTYANISIVLYIKGKPQIVIENILDFYELNHTYEIVCNSYGYPSTEVWWSWFPCKTPKYCLNSDNENGWINISSAERFDNEVNAKTYASKPYLIVSKLILLANISGIYRCSSMLFYHSDNLIIKHEEIPFIVMGMIYM